MIGRFNDQPSPNPEEVADYKWMTADEIKVDIQRNPSNYTAWFLIIFDKYYQYIS
jgi:isopentenyl-diphosphate delta-isomerase